MITKKVDQKFTIKYLKYIVPLFFHNPYRDYENKTN